MTFNNPDGLTSTIQILERQVSQLLPPSHAAPIVQALIDVRNGCLAEKKESSDWHMVDVHSKRVEQRLVSAKSLLGNGEDRAMELGMQLSYIYHHCDELPSSALRKQLLANSTTLCPATSAGRIKKKFAAASKIRTKAGYVWAPKIFTALTQELRWATE